jgi:hypothetical protein
MTEQNQAQMLAGVAATAKREKQRRAKLGTASNSVRSRVVRVDSHPMHEPAGVPATERDSAHDPEPILVVDLKTLRVTYSGHAIPTRPPHHLQRQPLLALAVLATRPGEIVTMAELAEGMLKLGGLRKRPVAPDAKDLRYKILQPFKRALSPANPLVALDRLLETVQGSLRLNTTAVCRLGPLVLREPRNLVLRFEFWARTP